MADTVSKKFIFSKEIRKALKAMQEDTGLSANDIVTAALAERVVKTIQTVGIKKFRQARKQFG